MWLVVLGFKSFNTVSKPDLIYVGASGQDALKAVESTRGLGYKRIGKIVNPPLIPMRVPDAEPQAPPPTPPEEAPETETPALPEEAPTAEAVIVTLPPTQPTRRHRK